MRKLVGHLLWLRQKWKRICERARPIRRFLGRLVYVSTIALIQVFLIIVGVYFAHGGFYWFSFLLIAVVLLLMVRLAITTAESYGVGNVAHDTTEPYHVLARNTVYLLVAIIPLPDSDESVVLVREFLGSRYYTLRLKQSVELTEVFATSGFTKRSAHPCYGAQVKMEKAFLRAGY